MRFRMAAAAVGLSLLLPAAAAAQDVGGVEVPSQLMLEDARLVLNGAGVRRHFFLNVYVGALYLERPAATPRAVIEMPAAKCMRLYFLRDVRADDITRELLEGLRASSGEKAFERLAPRVARLRDGIPDLRAGDTVRLEFPHPERTLAWINDVLVADVPGRDFQTAVLRFWLGEPPVDRGLKRALLGAK